MDRITTSNVAEGNGDAPEGVPFLDRHSRQPTAIHNSNSLDQIQIYVSIATGKSSLRFDYTSLQPEEAAHRSSVAPRASVPFIVSVLKTRAPPGHCQKCACGVDSDTDRAVGLGLALDIDNIIGVGFKMKRSRPPCTISL